MTAKIIDFSTYRQQKINQKEIRKQNMNHALSRTRTRINGESDFDYPLDHAIQACTEKLKIINEQLENGAKIHDYVGFFKKIMDGDLTVYHISINTNDDEIQLPPFIRNRGITTLLIKYKNFRYINPDRYGVGIELLWNKTPHTLYIPYHTITEIKKVD